MTDLEAQNLLGKPLLAVFVAAPIALVLGICASILLNEILHAHHLAGAIGGVFVHGVLSVIQTGLICGVVFSYTLAFQRRAVRISFGILFGAIIGAAFADHYQGHSSPDLLGRGFFLGYGALWGALGGALFAAVIREVFVRSNLSSGIHLPGWITDRAVIGGGMFALGAAFVPIVFSGTQPFNAEGNVHVVMASFSDCKAAEDQIRKLSVPRDVFSPRIVYTPNGQYAVSLGEFTGPVARRTMVSAIRKKVIPRNSFLLASRDLTRDEVTCKNT